MSKVTSKLQVTLPKALADAYGIEPGDEIDWVEAGDSIRVIPHTGRQTRGDLESRLRVFDQATVRQRARDAGKPRRPSSQPPADRGWTREELYDRGRTD